MWYYYYILGFNVLVTSPASSEEPRQIATIDLIVGRRLNA